jgi:hypothetical protein
MRWCDEWSSRRCRCRSSCEPQPQPRRRRRRQSTILRPHPRRECHHSGTRHCHSLRLGEGRVELLPPHPAPRPLMTGALARRPVPKKSRDEECRSRRNPRPASFLWQMLNRGTRRNVVVLTVPRHGKRAEKVVSMIIIHLLGWSDCTVREKPKVGWSVTGAEADGSVLR